MKQYHIDIIVSEKEVQTIREEFSAFLEESGGFTLRLIPDNQEAVPSPELEATIRKMFYSLLMTIDLVKFRSVQ